MPTDIQVTFAKSQALPAESVEGRVQVVDDGTGKAEAYVGTETDWTKLTDKNKADKPTSPVAGDIASLDASGNIEDSGISANDLMALPNIIVIQEPLTDGTFQLIATRTSGVTTYSFETTA